MLAPRFCMNPRRASLLLAALLACPAAACGSSSGDAPPLTYYDASPVLMLPPPGADAAKPREAGAVDAGHDAAHDAMRDTALAVDAGHDARDATGQPRDAGVDVVVTTDAMYPAFNVEVPQVTDNGGGVVANAKFVPVVFSGETLGPSIAAFMSAVGGSTYWATIGAEYGVGPATSSPLVVDTYAPASAITDAEIQAWLANAIATDPRFLALSASPDAGIQPADPSAVPPADTVYVLFYPAGVSIDDGAGESCAAFGGYHFNFNLGNGASVVYAVVPRCPNFDMLNGIEEVTAVTSHELIEATTDPQPYTSPGFVGTDQDHFIWELVLGNGEVGDMCSFLPNAFIYPTDTGFDSYLVQRTWSNQAALLHEDPCVPAVGEPAYFGAVPETTEVSFVDQGMTYQTLGTQIPVGNTATVTLDLFSTGPTSGPWTVYLLDYGMAYNNPTVLDIQSIGTAEGVNGQKVQFSIKPLSAGTAALFGIAPYFVYGENADQTQSSFWVGAVVN
jgi:hypothetical protein